MTGQQILFDFAAEDRRLRALERNVAAEFPPAARRTDPATSHQAARKLEPRRGSQASRILDRLQRGPATNAELAALCLKYTGRISDLRAQGWRIECERQRDDGVTFYRLAGQA